MTRIECFANDFESGASMTLVRVIRGTATPIKKPAVSAGYCQAIEFVCDSYWTCGRAAQNFRTPTATPQTMHTKPPKSDAAGSGIAATSV